MMDSCNCNGADCWRYGCQRYRTLPPQESLPSGFEMEGRRQDARLRCLEIAGGDVEKAEQLLAWVRAIG